MGIEAGKCNTHRRKTQNEAARKPKAVETGKRPRGSGDEEKAREREDTLLCESRVLPQLRLVTGKENHGKSEIMGK